MSFSQNRRALEYVQPLCQIRGADLRDEVELAAYLRRGRDAAAGDGGRQRRARGVGAPPRASRTFVRHVVPLPRPERIGKVAGVVMGLDLGRGELVVIADDDVRSDAPDSRAWSGCWQLDPVVLAELGRGLAGRARVYPPDAAL